MGVKFIKCSDTLYRYGNDGKLLFKRSEKYTYEGTSRNYKIYFHTDSGYVHDNWITFSKSELYHKPIVRGYRITKQFNPEGILLQKDSSEKFRLYTNLYSDINRNLLKKSLSSSGDEINELDAIFYDEQSGRRKGVLKGNHLYINIGAGINFLSLNSLLMKRLSNDFEFGEDWVSV